ncbi:hypothetical protein [Brevibacterium otitidis]|uniref:ANTAR domain-containing protein n=1 Tax=Brevibacterium otitidis TaxID=53364 RepID=A0ABV5X116_9MICO|nr:hypothetical protein GCM10023233_04750 [Brevibacterium otitidis]
MTTWDERATAFMRDLEWPATMCATGRMMAAWQREQLLTDDVIERAAMAILLRKYRGCTPDEARRYAGAGERDDARNDARTVLTTLLGDST